MIWSYKIIALVAAENDKVCKSFVDWNKSGEWWEIVEGGPMFKIDLLDWNATNRQAKCRNEGQE